MRRLSDRLVASLQRSASDEASVFAALGHTLSQVRGRPVHLRGFAFPPHTASGLWVDRAEHDLIAYEEKTDPDHQLVIIGHEVWHMFQGHCVHRTEHGPAASRARREAAAAVEELVRLVAGDDDLAAVPPRHDAALHFAARADADHPDERDADRFGFRFATDVRTFLEDARTSADPGALSCRIRASMAHRGIPRP
ncbi:toxin-antitoxin system, toxin component [Streptomyces sp. NPDC005526]|uniref:toxin-antitoxin system, toxin component n=1 Tax=Streptomyces sp. NPDC005526 TaxID=3156885 RepID=UPI0033A63724